MKHIWKGSIAFGLVNIPVGLGTAVREEGISFRMLRESDMSPINFKRVAEVDGKEVPYDKIAKGYEYEKGKFVLMTKVDFDRVELAAAKSITIETFVDADEVNPMHFHKPYYMEPDKGADHAFVLLRDALMATRKIGIARVVISNRQHLAAVKPHAGTLILELMHFADEIVPDTEVRKPLAALGKKEMEMAKGLITQMAEPWQPDAFKDEYTGQVLKLIEQKVKAGGKLPPPQLQQKTAGVVDLMAALEKSLATAGKKKKAAPVTALKTKRKAG
jgi:DNA end-binding protein Ku